MKSIKAILFVVALACTMLINYACNPDKKTGDAKITVNTAAIYDELDITGPMKERALATQGFTIIDTLLIYDQQGLLVSKQGAESKVINPVTFEATGLPDGTYTFIAWQSVRHEEVGSVWCCSGEDKLATASIIADSPCMSYQFALGYAMATAAVGGGRVEMEMTPKAMGCVVDLRADNLPSESEDSYLFFENAEKPVPCGVRLDPTLGEDDRLIPAGEDHYVIAYVETSEPKYRHFTLAHDVGDSFYFWFWDGKEESDEYCVGDLIDTKMGPGEYYVCYLDLGRITWQPPFFGTTEAFDVWKADRDAGILVSNPVVDWGCNFDKVEQHIKAKQWWRPGNDKFEFWGDNFNCWHRWYSVAPQLTEQYLFETEDGKNLRYSLACTWDPTLPVEVAKNSLLKQGYVYKGRILYPGDTNTGDCFISPDGKTQAEVYLYEDNCWEIVYHATNPDSFGYITDKVQAGKREYGRECRVPADPGKGASGHPAIISKVSRYHF